MCDPWLTDGCYYGAWAHYPEFTDWWSKDLQNIDYIYVSHIHPDHFDKPTMLGLKGVWGGKQPPVLMHKFPFRFFRKQVEDLGYEVIEIENGGKFDLSPQAEIRIFSADNCDPAACGSFYGCTMPASIDSQIDSLAVIKDGHHTVVNVNDCPIGLSKTLCEKIASEYEVDLAMVAYAGAGPYPQCFVMPPGHMISQAVKKRHQFIDNVAAFAKVLRARRVFPFAGDYQLCGRLSALNEFRGVPELRDVHIRLCDMGVRTIGIEPGQTVDINQRAFFDLEDTRLDRMSYVNNVLANRRLDFDDDQEPKVEAERLWPDAFKRFESKRREYGGTWNATAYIQNGDHYFMMPPEGGWSIVAKVDREEPYVSISCDQRLLTRLLSGPRDGAHWNNAQIGSHITFDRQPVELYEPALYHLLSYLHA